MPPPTLRLQDLASRDREKVLLFLAAADTEDIEFVAEDDSVFATWTVRPDAPEANAVRDLLSRCWREPSHPHRARCDSPAAKAAASLRKSRVKHPRDTSECSLLAPPTSDVDLPLHPHSPSASSTRGITHTTLHREAPPPPPILPGCSDVPAGEPRSAAWTIRLIEEIWSQQCKAVSEGGDRQEYGRGVYAFAYYFFTRKFGLESLVESTLADVVYNAQRFSKMAMVCEIFAAMVSPLGPYSDLDLKFFVIARSHACAFAVADTATVKASDGRSHLIPRKLLPVKSLPSLTKRILYRHPHAAYIRSCIASWLEDREARLCHGRRDHVELYEFLQYVVTIYTEEPVQPQQPPAVPSQRATASPSDVDLTEAVMFYHDMATSDDRSEGYTCQVLSRSQSRSSPLTIADTARRGGREGEQPGTAPTCDKDRGREIEIERNLARLEAEMAELKRMKTHLAGQRGDQSGEGSKETSPDPPPAVNYEQVNYENTERGQVKHRQRERKVNHDEMERGLKGHKQMERRVRCEEDRGYEEQKQRELREVNYEGMDYEGADRGKWGYEGVAREEVSHRQKVVREVTYEETDRGRVSREKRELKNAYEEVDIGYSDREQGLPPREVKYETGYDEAEVVHKHIRKDFEEMDLSPEQATHEQGEDYEERGREQVIHNQRPGQSQRESPEVHYDGLQLGRADHEETVIPSVSYEHAERDPSPIPASPPPQHPSPPPPPPHHVSPPYECPTTGWGGDAFPADTSSAIFSQPLHGANDEMESVPAELLGEGGLHVHRSSSSLSHASTVSGPPYDEPDDDRSSAQSANLLEEDGLTQPERMLYESLATALAREKDPSPEPSVPAKFPCYNSSPNTTLGDLDFEPEPVDGAYSRSPAPPLTLYGSDGLFEDEQATPLELLARDHCMRRT